MVSHRESTLDPLESTTESGGLKRHLSARHIQLISIGGAIGVGLFMGSGKMVSLAGTSILLIYAIIGFFMFFTMRAMGELLLSNLKYKSFADCIAAYLGPKAGFFTAWSYWLVGVVAVVSECIVVGKYFQYWYPDLPVWIPAFTALGMLFVLNILTVKVFGELEFWFALIKIVAIVGMIVAAIKLIAVAHVSPDGVTASVDHLLNRDSFMPHGIMGFFAGFQLAVTSFAGVELIGTTAAEAKNPTRTLPRAINAVPLRIFLFYGLALASVICVASLAHISPDKSPFVQVFLLAGFPLAAGMVNFVVTTSAMSSANSNLYSSGRMLYGLAIKSDAPVAFSRCSAKSVPLSAVLYSSACMFVGMLLVFVIPDFMTLFTLLTTVSAILYIFVWSLILAAYLVYRKKDSALHEASSFKMPGGTIMAMSCLAFFAFVIVLLTFEADTRHGLMIMPAWFISLYLCYAYFQRKGSLKARPQLL